jgi:hypothetical protein
VQERALAGVASSLYQLCQLGCAAAGAFDPQKTKFPQRLGRRIADRKEPLVAQGRVRGQGAGAIATGNQDGLEIAQLERRP